MISLVPPEGKLTLRRWEGSRDEPTPKPLQAMRLNLSQSTLDELLEGLRNDKNAHLRLGKQPQLFYGTKTQSFHFSAPNHHSELYVSSPATDQENIYFSGILSHNLEVQKAREATTVTDEALANLKQSLSAFEKGKELRMTPMITSIDQMRALKTGNNRTATGRAAAGLARKSTSKVDLEKERFFKNAASRSSPASPALLASHSPARHSALTPTSAQLPMNKDKIRLDALRLPLIHLLAIRPASVAAIAEKTRASQGDCLTLLRKYGIENRQDRNKFDLRDKAYRDLDVWKFPYPSQEVRQEAIENAISAFDRMRISRQDKLWQMLLPKEERGKGKVLSRLNLRTGPMPKSATLRVNVQASEEPLKEGHGTGNELETASGKLTPSINATENSKPKAAAQKKQPVNKPGPTKRAPAKSNNNTTLTGRVTKKADKRAGGKPSAKADSKIKSAEFVVDSDEDIEVTDVSNSKSSPQESTRKELKERHSARPEKPGTKDPLPVQPLKEKEVPPKLQATKTIPSPPSVNSQTGNSSSLQKPSPLGSSPPTDASDFETAAQSSVTTQSPSSSSPLISQLPMQRAMTGASGTNQKKSQMPVTKAHSASQSLKRKGEMDPEAETAPQAKSGRMFGLGISQTNGRASVPEPKRRRTLSSDGSSTGSASPPVAQEILRRQLHEKTQQFKQYYAKYRMLHEQLSNHPDPPRDKLEKLEKQHMRLEKMKQEIWDEDRRLRFG